MKSSLFVLAALFLAVALAAPAPEAEAEAEPQDYLADEFEDAYDYDAADVDEDVQSKFFLGGFRRPIVFRRPIIARRPIVARRRFFG